MITRSTLLVRHSRDELRAVLIEHTWELSAFLEDIEHAELKEHSSPKAGVQSARHMWRAKTNVPLLLAPHIDADYFAWTAVVEWDSNDYVSGWRIEPHALKESLICTANVVLKEALGGRATQIMIDVNIEGLDGRRGIETIAYRIVLVNWQKLIEAATQRLQSDI
jgi:hypothetical protein